jgi:uncharacterized Ntn-hydrolase superfamily protein
MPCVQQVFMVLTRIRLIRQSFKSGDKSLTAGDIRVLDMRMNTSRNSAKIEEVFETVETKMGSSPSYVVSDNASTISKAIRRKGYTHIRDIWSQFWSSHPTGL